MSELVGAASLPHPSDGERGALIALAGLPSIGPGQLRRLVSGLGPVGALDALRRGASLPLKAKPKLLASWRDAARVADPAELLDDHRRANVTARVFGEANYPAALLDDPDPPQVLFSAGSASVRAEASVALVGTRRCSRYGRDIAYELGSRLAALGISVVSGLALGIDAAGHAGALSHDQAHDSAAPIGVVASGLDRIYPRQNAGLWTEVRSRGLLVSEVPLGGQANRWRFPARNRLVAAVSAVIVVVESAARGGSLYTVDEALARNRDVWAVPGPIRSPVSAGTNRLIADGAAPLWDIDHFIESLDICTRPMSASACDTRADGARAEPVGPAEAEVLEAVGWMPCVPELLAARLDRPLPQVLLSLERLVAGGFLVRTGGVVERQA